MPPHGDPIQHHQLYLSCHQPCQALPLTIHHFPCFPSQAGNLILTLPAQSVQSYAQNSSCTIPEPGLGFGAGRSPLLSFVVLVHGLYQSVGMGQAPS